MAKITPDDRVLKRGSLPFFWLGEEIPAARSGVRTVLYLPTAAPLPLADTLSVQKIYFIDLETRKTLSAHCLYKSGVLHLEQAPCYRDALLIIEGESPC